LFALLPPTPVEALKQDFGYEQFRPAQAVKAFWLLLPVELMLK
jgi:hypothetical protein